ncbi:MAG: hypothetical protein ACJ8M4_12260 [Chthoniobacterales bacterium]
MILPSSAGIVEVWNIKASYVKDEQSAREPVLGTEKPAAGDDEAKIVCPVCGAAVVQEKCKLICRSDVCLGRVVMNCSEF